MRKMLLIVFAMFMLMTGSASAKELVTVYHIVQSGETLESIARVYITDDRYLPEYMEGIMELNYERVFMKREQSGLGKVLYPGDMIEVKYWR